MLVAGSLSENKNVMNQIGNNFLEQALLGDFAEALADAVVKSGVAHEKQNIQYLNYKELAAGL